MIISKFNSFIEDESGAYTVWSLVWFSLYVAIGGLAVDMTDAYRTKTLLQSTADASVLAAAMSLPDQDDGRSQAVNFSKDNMQQTDHGTVVRPSEVVFGTWNIATRTFTQGATSSGDPLVPDAAMVTSRRASGNENPLATNFLRIIGLMDWDVNTTSIAIKYVPECIRGGFVAYNRVDTNSNNHYINEICIHGQNLVDDTGQNDAVEVQNNSIFDPGVNVSMPDKNDLSNLPQVYSNQGLEEAHTEGDAYPADVAKLDEIIDGLTTDGSIYQPPYITDTTVVNITSSYNGPYDAGKVYYATCQGGSDLTLPTNTVIQDVVIVSECGIQASNGLSLTNVAIASKSVGNGQNPLSSHEINFASQTNLGSATFCTTGDGGVEIYAKASAHVAAGTVASGIRIVVGGDLELTSQLDILGVSAQAGNDIDHTSNGDAGLCPQGTPPPGVFAYHHRLVF
ncbi:MAG: Tad domain-containing protein [Paracoccaceae bacterium]|nr:Tad domain-containing protein [Paracoccaceae bacterium]